MPRTLLLRAPRGRVAFGTARTDRARTDRACIGTVHVAAARFGTVLFGAVVSGAACAGAARSVAACVAAIGFGAWLGASRTGHRLAGSFRGRTPAHGRLRRAVLGRLRALRRLLGLRPGRFFPGTPGLRGRPLQRLPGPFRSPAPPFLVPADRSCRPPGVPRPVTRRRRLTSLTRNALRPLPRTTDRPPRALGRRTPPHLTGRLPARRHLSDSTLPGRIAVLRTALRTPARTVLRVLVRAVTRTGLRALRAIRLALGGQSTAGLRCGLTCPRQGPSALQLPADPLQPYPHGRGRRLHLGPIVLLVLEELIVIVPVAGHAALLKVTRSASSASVSSVRAASPPVSTASAKERFAASSSAIRSSTVPSVTSRWTCTGWVCPIR